VQAGQETDRAKADRRAKPVWRVAGVDRMPELALTRSGDCDPSVKLDWERTANRI